MSSGPSKSQLPMPVTGAEKVTSSADAARTDNPAPRHASNAAASAHRLNMVRPLLIRVTSAAARAAGGHEKPVPQDCEFYPKFSGSYRASQFQLFQLGSSFFSLREQHPHGVGRRVQDGESALA